MKTVFPKTFLIRKRDSFPNNDHLPVVLYRNVTTNLDAKSALALIAKNGWHRPWINGIYSYHHYHSNTHEVLFVTEGSVSVQLGGPIGEVLQLEKGDVLILPVGVSHKNLGASDDLEVVGAYPFDIEYDLCDEKKDVEPQKLPLPKTDPVYGEDGPLLEVWF